MLTATYLAGSHREPAFFCVVEFYLRVYRDFFCFRYFRQISCANTTLKQSLADVVCGHIIVSVFVAYDANDISVIHFTNDSHVI